MTEYIHQIKEIKEAWTAEEIESIEEMRQIADKEANRRFGDKNVKELFGV